MDRRNFFKKASVTSLGLIFTPAVVKVLAEGSYFREIPKIRAGKGLWAYVQKNGITKFYPNGTVDMNDIMSGHHVTHHYNHLTGSGGMEALKKVVHDHQMTWFRLQAALENEKN